MNTKAIALTILLKEHLSFSHGELLSDQTLPFDRIYLLMQSKPIDFQEGTDVILNFASKKKRARKERNCNPQRSFPCGNSCQTLKPRADGTPRQCRKRLDGQASNAQEWLARNMPASGQPQKTLTHKPLMTKQEAEEFAKNSAITDILYHGTSVKGAESITTEGVDISRNETAMFGQGFYSSPSKSTANEYGYDDEAEGQAGRVLGMRFNVSNPKEFSDIGDFFNWRKKEGLDPGPGNASGPADITNRLKEQGFDSAIINVGFDGSPEVIAFEKEQVVVFEINNTEVER